MHSVIKNQVTFRAPSVLGYNCTLFPKKKGFEPDPSRYKVLNFSAFSLPTQHAIRGRGKWGKNALSTSLCQNPVFSAERDIFPLIKHVQKNSEGFFGFCTHTLTPYSQTRPPGQWAGFSSREPNDVVVNLLVVRIRSGEKWQCFASLSPARSLTPLTLPGLGGVLVFFCVAFPPCSGFMSLSARRLTQHPRQFGVTVLPESLRSWWAGTAVHGSWNRG